MVFSTAVPGIDPDRFLDRAFDRGFDRALVELVFFPLAEAGLRVRLALPSELVRELDRFPDPLLFELEDPLDEPFRLVALRVVLAVCACAISLSFAGCCAWRGSQRPAGPLPGLCRALRASILRPLPQGTPEIRANSAKPRSACQVAPTNGSDTRSCALVGLACDHQARGLGPRSRARCLKTQAGPTCSSWTSNSHPTSASRSLRREERKTTEGANARAQW